MAGSPSIAAPHAAREHATLVACVAWVLGVAPEELPAGRGPDPLPALRGWVARRDLGLVPVADPAAFALPGYWLGRIPSPRGPAARWVVLFGVPSGIVWDPAGGTGEAADADAGLVLAQLDPRATGRAAAAADAGVVEQVLVAPEVQGPMHAVAEARASAAGLAGDRYAAGAGTFSSPSATGTALTLVEAEAVEAVVLPGGGRLAPGDARRNVVTRGIALDALLGRRFAVGEVECFGQRRCEPCAHLERLTRPGVLRALVHRGGLRADVLTPGVVRPGDVVRALD